MRHRLLAGAVLAALLWLTAAPARSEPSVLVELTSLEKGSLPQTVTAYGSVQPSSSARQTVTAPLAAVVGEIQVRQGQQVAQGAPLIQLLPSPQAAASYAQAQSALAVAKQLVARTRQLVGQHLATEQQLSEAEKSAADAQSALAALQAQGAGGPNLLRAPFGAIVTGITTSPGAMVAEGTALLDLARPQGLVLRVGTVPARAAAINPGDPVQITRLGEHQAVAGKVLLRGSVIAAGDGLVPVDISLPEGRFLPGEMAEASITTGEVAGYLVPHDAILVDDRGEPYVVQAIDGIARKVAVHILAAASDKDVIEGPLNVAAPLVLAGNHQLEDGMKVRTAAANAKPTP